VIVNLEVPADTWQEILEGHVISIKGPNYFYEGDEFHTRWLFNSRFVGCLEVFYDDSGVGYAGYYESAIVKD